MPHKKAKKNKEDRKPVASGSESGVTPEETTKKSQGEATVDQVFDEQTGDDVDAALAGLAELRDELDEAKDRALRACAELENYKKRIAREMDDERRYANISLMRDLLPVWDNMGRAIEAAEKGQDHEGLLAGFRMVVGQLKTVLTKHDCVEIDSLHQPFDPNCHEAILQQPSADFPAGTVLTVVDTGFQLHDRVVRPSRVIVSTAPPEEADEE